MAMAMAASTATSSAVSPSPPTTKNVHNNSNKNNIEWKINVPEDASIKIIPLRKPKIVTVMDSAKKWVLGLLQMLWKLGTDDPRRIYHSIKVGVALTLVSLFYFMHPLYVSVGGMATWAVMTVVVIFEFTAGGTLSKGLNRMAATLLGGLLAVATNFVADVAGRRKELAEPVLLGVGVFIVGAAATFVRFVPKMKQRYDYGVLIFILTYSFMTVSGFREQKLFAMACQRLATIIIGCVLCIIVSIVFCPIWAGEDLHFLLINNTKSLAFSLEGCVAQYFAEEEEETLDEETEKACNGYKCVLNSKASEESLANFARWEPPHGKFSFRYPWKQYVKIGARLRYCAYCVEALNGCLNSEIQTPRFLREQLKAPCMSIAAESCRVLLDLSECLRSMSTCPEPRLMMARVNKAAQSLHNCLASQRDLLLGSSNRWKLENPETKTSDHKTSPNNTNAESMGGRVTVTMAFMDTLPLATVACLLTEIVARLETVVVEVHELGRRASFAKLLVDSHHKTQRVHNNPISSMNTNSSVSETEARSHSNAPTIGEANTTTSATVTAHRQHDANMSS